MPPKKSPSRKKPPAKAPPQSVYGRVIQFACERFPDTVTSDEFRRECGQAAATVLTMAVRRGNLDHIGPSEYRYDPDGRHGGDARVLLIEPMATSESDLAARARVGMVRVRKVLAEAGITRFRK